MDQILDLVGNATTVMVAIGAALGGVFIVYCGYLFMSSLGDPHKVAQARGAGVGVVIGLVIMGMSFLIPTFVSDTIVEPAGGVSVQSRNSVDCDELFRDLLVGNSTINTPERMNNAIGQIRASNDQCPQELWDPDVSDSVVAGDECQDSTGVLNGVTLPTSLREGGPTGEVNNDTYRSRGGMVIYFGPLKRPSDGAPCWVYIARLRTWLSHYR